MRCDYACQSPDHLLARRQFLKLSAAGGALGGLLSGGFGGQPLRAQELTRRGMRVVVFNMHGGLSQLESWDPKPGVETGGPFRAIPTSVPGIHISELLPLTAQQMHHLCLVRGVNTAEDDHGKGLYLMTTGRRQTPAADYPKLGAVMAKALTTDENPLPGHVVITPGGSGGRNNDSAYLGPRYASVALGNGKPPQNLVRPEQVSEQADQVRNEFRQRLNERFLSRRRTAILEAYTQSYEQARQMMTQGDAFDVSRETPEAAERYGTHDLGRHCLLARRLLERGVAFVQVSHSNYDTHNENFNFHLEQMGEFDRAFSTFVADIAERGMLDSTLIVVLSEFGRTPNINQLCGRDHWSRAWSVLVAGAKMRRGFAYGQTNDKGTEVIDGQVDHGRLFHTYLQSVGVDSTGSFSIDGRDVPIADPSTHVIRDILA